MKPISHEMYANFVRDHFKTDLQPSPKAAAIVHAVIGLRGEVDEVEDAYFGSPHEMEEFGDICFYLEALHQALGEGRGTSPQFSPSLSAVSAQMLDLAKKYWVYNKDTTEELRGLAASFAQRLGWELRDRGWTVEQVLTANVRKLQKRYPSGTYSDADAQARADKPAGE